MTMVVVDTPTRRRIPGRPALPAADRRHNSVMVRLSDAELALLDERRGKVQRGSWLRSAALDAVPPRLSNMDIESIRLLSSMSNNINQLAHKLNAGGGFDVADRRSVLMAAEAIRQLRQDILGISR